MEAVCNFFKLCDEFGELGENLGIISDLPKLCDEFGGRLEKGWRKVGERLERLEIISNLVFEISVSSHF